MGALQGEGSHQWLLGWYLFFAGLQYRVFLSDHGISVRRLILGEKFTTWEAVRYVRPAGDGMDIILEAAMVGNMKISLWIHNPGRLRQFLETRVPSDRWEPAAAELPEMTA